MNAGAGSTQANDGGIYVAIEEPQSSEEDDTYDSPTATPTVDPAEISAPATAPLKGIALARQLLSAIDSCPMEPQTQKDIWYGIDGDFVEALRKLAISANDSDNELPPIHNWQYLSSPLALSSADRGAPRRVTPRTLLNPTKVSLLWIDKQTWSLLKQSVTYDVSIPRKVTSKDRFHLQVEMQPVKVWLDISKNQNSSKFIQTSYSLRDNLQSLFEFAGRVLSLPAEEITFQYAQVNCDYDSVPASQRDVGIWHSLPVTYESSSNVTFEALRLTEVVALSVSHVPSPQRNLKPLEDSGKSSSDFDDDAGESEGQLSLVSDIQGTKSVQKESLSAILGSGGFTGLQNLGNTCFMNSALQCLSHALPLTEFFLSGSYKKDLNVTNPLGMHGRLARAYAQFLESYWNTAHAHRESGRSNGVGSCSVGPRELKCVIGHFAPQFLGFQQQDSQELAAFLLDGLHEDLNRVLSKPYIEAMSGGDDSNNEDLGEEAWRNHERRNDSVIVDLFQGQYRSRLECPECKKISVVFDPFMYLSLPIAKNENISINISFTIPPLHDKDDSSEITDAAFLRQIFHGQQPSTETSQKLKSFHQQPISFNFNSVLKTNDSLPTLKKRLLKKLIKHSDQLHKYTFFRRTLPNDILSIVKNFHDQTYLEGAAVKLLNNLLVLELESTTYRVFPNISVFRPSRFAKAQSSHHPLDLALVFVPSDDSFVDRAERLTSTLMESPGSSPTIRKSGVAIAAEANNATTVLYAHIPSWEGPSSLSYSHRISPATLMLVAETFDDSSTLEECGKRAWDFAGNAPMGKSLLLCLADRSAADDGPSFWPAISVKPETTPVSLRQCLREKNDEFVDGVCHLICCGWENRKVHRVDVDDEKEAHLGSGGFSVTLEKCLNEFQREEKLGANNMWYCNRCKKHQQAKKRIDIWRLPPILIIHLKRFTQASRYYRTKNNATLLFDPSTETLDMSKFIPASHRRRIDKQNLKYHLFGVSQHVGSLSGGHYTAAVNCRVQKEDGTVEEDWYDFNDTLVTPCRDVKKCAANGYLLFLEQSDFRQKSFSLCERRH